MSGRADVEVRTRALGRALRDLRTRFKMSRRDLARCLYAKHFGEATGYRFSEAELLDIIERIERGGWLPFDVNLLRSFNQLAAKCLGGGNELREKVALDNLAMATIQDFGDDMGF